MLKQLTRARLAWLALVILAILLVLYRCTGGADAAPEYQAAPAEKTNVVSRVSTSGSLQAVVTVDVGSQVSGRVQELYADFNSKVRKGEKIAKIDPSLFQAAVVQAEANVIRRREETNATRSLLNTARVMAENPVMLRLKELEALEAIAGKVERLTIHNGTAGLMNDLVQLRDT